MWSYHAFRWPSEAAWLEALAAEGWAQGAPPEVELLVGGTLYGPAPDVETPPPALPGWHVAAAFRDRAPPAGWAALEIEPPAQMPVLGRSPVPVTVSRFQARAALLAADLLQAVEAAIAASGNPVAQLAWADAVEFRRDSPTIAAMAAALGLTDAQVDNLFRTAAGILA